MMDLIFYNASQVVTVAAGGARRKQGAEMRDIGLIEDGAVAVKNGRIDREFADADRRRSILNLSEEGRRVHDEIAPLALKFERDLLQEISDDETEQLRVIMDRLLARARMLDKG